LLFIGPIIMCRNTFDFGRNKRLKSRNKHELFNTFHAHLILKMRVPTIDLIANSNSSVDSVS